MTRDERIQHHSERAKAELDLASRADNEKVAKAHFDLSALHLKRLHSLGVEPAGPVMALLDR